MHSFNADAVDAVRRAAPELHTALTHEKTPITGKEAARYGTSLNVSASSPPRMRSATGTPPG
ncbi:hypothetical protein ACFQ3Z_44665 [Streptomyces nogalater]